MKILITGCASIATVIALSGCAASSIDTVNNKLNNPGLGSYGDAATTAIALSSGYTEMNPLLNGLAGGDPLTTAVLSIGLKAGGKELLTMNGVKEDTAHRSVETIGIAASAWNIGVMAGASTGVGLPLALLAGYAYWEWTDTDKECSGDGPYGVTLHGGVAYDAEDLEYCKGVVELNE